MVRVMFNANRLTCFCIQNSLFTQEFAHTSILHLDKTNLTTPCKFISAAFFGLPGSELDPQRLRHLSQARQGPAADTPAARTAVNKQYNVFCLAQRNSTLSESRNGLHYQRNILVTCSAIYWRADGIFIIILIWSWSLC